MTISRINARRLAIDATEMGARILRGTLTVEADQTRIDETNLLEWLSQLAGSELMLIAVPIGYKVTEEEDELKSCNTCGRDYKGPSCPYCAEVRARLRG